MTSSRKASLTVGVSLITSHAFISDAPARAYLKSIKGHTAYYGREKCTQKGTYSVCNNKVIFPDCESPLRTDKSFTLKLQPHHHHGESPLLCLGIGLVSQFPLDYMHLVCLGVMKKLLIKYWVFGKPCPSKMHHAAKTALSHCLECYDAHVPRDVKRRPRGSLFLEQWKAVEHRNFLLYYGPVAMTEILDSRFYKHFMKFNVAVTILVSQKFCATHIDVSECLLDEFFAEAGELYGKGIYIYNVHSLLHVVNDVRMFGPFDAYSAFPFENYLHEVKTLL